MTKEQFNNLEYGLRQSVILQYADAMHEGRYCNCDEDSCYYKGKIDALKAIFGADNLKEYDDLYE